MISSKPPVFHFLKYWRSESPGFLTEQEGQAGYSDFTATNILLDLIALFPQLAIGHLDKCVFTAFAGLSPVPDINY